MPVSVTPIHKKKYRKWKSAHLERDEGASKREQEEEADKADYCKVRSSQEQEEKERQPLIREKEEEKLINEAVTTLIPD